LPYYSGPQVQVPYTYGIGFKLLFLGLLHYL